jgi:hypothetical protein
MTNDTLIEWAKNRIQMVRWWSICYWTIYVWFSALSWIVAIVVPVGSAIMLYVEEPQRRAWNIAILAIGGFGLVLQVLANVLRFKERSMRGRRTTNKLESALLKYQSGQIETSEFHHAIENFMEEDHQEEGP